ncbi:13784_t:CDS:1, partial [Racocetra fulgida]
FALYMKESDHISSNQGYEEEVESFNTDYNKEVELFDSDSDI